MKRNVESALVLLLLLTSTRIFFDPFSRVIAVVMLFPAIYFWHMYSRRLSSFAIAYLYAMIVWVIYTWATTGVMEIETALGHFVRITDAILIVTIVEERFFDLFTKWVTRLAAAGLPFFVLGALFPSILHTLFDLVPWFLKLDTNVMFGDELISSWRRFSFGFVTLSPDRSYQNHGFMWEPAAFALLTVTALAIRVGQQHRILDKPGIILIVATLTTLSTTGFAALSLVILYQGFRKRIVGPIIILAILPILVVAFFYFDFLLPKIQAEFSAGYSESMNWSLSRYASFIRDMGEFKLSPILGSGLFDAGRPPYNPGLPSNNGMSDYLVRYGVLWSAATVFMYIASIRYSGNTRMTDTIFILVIILLFSWSEKFFELPVFLTLQALALSATRNGSLQGNRLRPIIGVQTLIADQAVKCSSNSK